MPTDFQQECQEHSMGKEQLFNKQLLDNWMDFLLQKNEAVPHTIYQKLTQNASHQNVRAETLKLLKEGGGGAE